MLPGSVVDPEEESPVGTELLYPDGGWTLEDLPDFPMFEPDETTLESMSVAVYVAE